MQTFNFLMAHKAALTVAGAWALREAHNLWPIIRPSVSLPFLESHGGLRGIRDTIMGPKQQTPAKIQLVPLGAPGQSV